MERVGAGVAPVPVEVVLGEGRAGPGGLEELVGRGDGELGRHHLGLRRRDLRLGDGRDRGLGHGAVEGVAGPESANNAAAQTSFIPLLTLGIPPNPVMALMVGAMTIHGIVPGPQVMTKQPELFWGMISSMWLGNLMLVVINLPLVGVWVRLLRVPYRHLFPMIVIFCCIGVYSLNNAPFDVTMTAIFGVVGYWLVKHDFQPTPLLLGLVLGPMLEENLRRAMLTGRGDPTVFLTRPISATLLAISAFMLILAVLPAIRGKREEVFTE